MAEAPADQPAHDASDQLLLLLASGRVRDAVALLNGLSRHRFTALFQFDGDLLGNQLLYDRDAGFTTPLEVIPIAESYCTFVQSTMQPFVVEDAPRDPRVAGHPKQPVVRSYVGVPLRTRAGMAFGTICHFDNEPVEATEGSLELMEMVGGWLSASHALANVFEGFNRRVAALGDMTAMIGDYAADAGQARERFDALAQPVRHAARLQLPPEGADEIDRRIDALRHRAGLDEDPASA